MAEPVDLSRVQALLDLHRAAEAEVMARSYLVGAPDSAEGLILLGQALSEQDKDQEALPVLEQAIAADPQAFRAHLVLCDVFLALRQADRAEDAAREVIRLAPWSWTGHYSLARALARSRRRHVREALAALDEAQKLAPHEPMVHSFRGLLLLDMRENRAAQLRFEEALRLDPNDEMALRGVSLLHANAGRLGRAGNVVTAALRANPHSRLARESLDHVVTLLLARWFGALAAGSLVLIPFLATDQAYYFRPPVAVLVVGLYAWHARNVLATLPDGVRWWGPETLTRLSRARLGLALFLVACSLVFLAACVLPNELAIAVSLGYFQVLVRLLVPLIVFSILAAGLTLAVSSGNRRGRKEG